MSNIHVVYAFSDNYYSSVATLNEMGAAWVMRCKWTGLLLPGFTFDKLAGCIDKNQICIKLDDPDIKQRLREFRNGIIEEFGLGSINEDKWEKKRDDFLLQKSSLFFLKPWMNEQKISRILFVHPLKICEQYGFIQSCSYKSKASNRPRTIQQKKVVVFGRLLSSKHSLPKIYLV